MTDYTGVDLTTLPGHIAVRKKTVPVSVRFARGDGVTETLEGPVRHEKGDAIVTGVAGERWPVERARFLASYDPLPPAEPGTDGPYRARAADAAAWRAEGPCTVKTTRGETLNGEAGDWIVRYEKGDYGIVKADLFDRLYTRKD